jgi:ubiquitin carboxyl-terminal hydrolase 4/11
MSQPTLINALTYYLVPSSWMLSTLPFLRGEAEQRPSQRIENTVLVLNGHISDEEHEEVSYTQKSRHKSIDLRRDIEHQRDFYCIGSHVWNLITENFDVDIELKFPVILHGHCTLAVDLGVQRVIIPHSGRFEYNHVVASDVVSDEEDDLVGIELSLCLNRNTSHVPKKFPYSSDTSSRPVSPPRSIPAPDEEVSNVVTSSAIILLPNSQPEDRDSDMELDSSFGISTLKRKRYGSGLGNLGNTCFMNSTIQCLAHTEPLRQYFCSGAFKNDLNHDNPLGTGGELATAFADLLSEMWGSRKSSTFLSNGVVYPRKFKMTLGKHAEQFLGYDQHDSQELATYLLDALHEDTNRITKKPYVIKPEQEEDEFDDVAAKKAWELHLQRENSRVLDNFMGQVKSRVQCPREGCGRVSTTFDPFMFLSVPIPGANEKTIKVKFVPIGSPRLCLDITLSKTDSILTLKKMVIEVIESMKGYQIDLKDVIAIEFWQNRVSTVFDSTHILQSVHCDEIIIYQLKPASDFPKVENVEQENEIPVYKDRIHHINMKSTDLVWFRTENDWKGIIEEKVSSESLKALLFNRKRLTIPPLIRFYNQLGELIDNCYEEIQEKSSLQSSNETATDEASGYGSPNSNPNLDEIQEQAFKAALDKSPLFRDVSDLSDLAALEFAEKKLHTYLMEEMKKQKERDTEIITIQVILLYNGRGDPSYTHGEHISIPLYLRTEGNTTVFGLREKLAKILPLKHLHNPRQTNVTELDSLSESMYSNSLPQHGEKLSGSCDQHDTDNELLIMRQIPMDYAENKSKRYIFHTKTQLGMIKAEAYDRSDHISPQLACTDDIEESKIVRDIVGNWGIVFLHWSDDLLSHFDLEAYDKTEAILSESEAEKNAKKVLSVIDCIHKYCQNEQLQESEMWYCSKCQSHVRAWKQIHLYRTPPILIVHLKRFHYSASTHRRDKIGSFIDFPLVGLDLTDFVSQWDDGQKPIYDCYAVSNHYGGLGGGHYTAYALSTDGTWCCFDDCRVSTNVDPSDVVSAAAYVLYYKRRDVLFDTPEYETPLPSHVQNFDELRNSPTLVRVDSMDLDDRAVSASPISSNTSTSALANMSANDDVDDVLDGNGYDSDQQFSHQNSSLG